MIADDVVDFAAPAVAELAADLWRMAGGDEIAFSRSAFEYVRDQIRHSWDRRPARDGDCVRGAA
ncbi:MAG: hypothetical protein WCB67_10295 [Solirubrobacteraceae bacterium]